MHNFSFGIDDRNMIQQKTKQKKYIYVYISRLTASHVKKKNKKKNLGTSLARF